MDMTYYSKNETDTHELAACLAKHSQPGDVYILEGELGAGKTAFTKGFGKALGIQRVIKSPTYTLIREYTDGRLPLYHMDLYRLEEEGADDLGLEEYFHGEGVTLVEWGSMVSEHLPKEHLLLTFSRIATAEEERNIQLTAVGQRYETLVQNVKEEQ